MQVTVPGSKKKHCIEEQISEEVRCGRTDGRTDRQQGKISKSEEVVIEMGSDRDYNTCRRLVDAMALSIVCICASKTLETLKQITLGRKPSQASLVSSLQRTPPLCARLLPLSLSLS